MMELKLTHVSKVIWAPGAHVEEYTAIWLNDAKKHSEQIIKKIGCTTPEGIMIYSYSTRQSIFQSEMFL